MQLSLATNADSLATWLLPALQNVMKQRQVELKLTIYGEYRSIEKLKSGEVTGAISLESQPIPGCRADYLGRIDYVCVASPEFYQRYFSKGVNIRHWQKHRPFHMTNMMIYIKHFLPSILTSILTALFITTSVVLKRF